MSKSGQPATKADTGGQRIPKSGVVRANNGTGTDKKAPKKSMPANKGAERKPGL